MDQDPQPEAFEPSLLRDHDEEPVSSQARILDTSAYSDSTERVIPDHGEASYHSELIMGGVGVFEMCSCLFEENVGTVNISS